MNRNTIIGTLVMTLALPSLLFVQGCGESDVRAIAQATVPDPPVSATFRQSMMSGYVLQLHNRSSNRVVARVYVENGKSGKNATYRFGVSPNEMAEVGMLEMDWAFELGEHGHIDIDGYRKKLYFKLLDSGQYQTWFDF